MSELIKSLLDTIRAGITLWDHEEADSYDKKLVALHERFNEEYNKDPAIRSDAVLDNVIAELRITANGLATRIREQNAQAKS